MSHEINVANIAIISGDEVLLLERSGLLDSPGKWGFSGGMVEDDDANPLSAALRETSEETGVDAHDLKVFAHSEYLIEGHISTKRPTETKTIRIDIYAAKLLIPKPEIRLAPGEHLSSRWFAIDDVVEDNLPADIHDRLLAGVPSMLAYLTARRELLHDSSLHGETIRRLK